MDPRQIQQRFLDAFATGGSKASEPGETLLSGQTSSQQRADAFQAAFGQREIKAPSNRAKTWRLNAAKAQAKRLNPAELFSLQEHLDRGTPYSEMPLWAIESGVIVPTQSEKVRQASLDKTTDTTIAERQEVFNFFQAQIGSLVALAELETLRGSVFLEAELDKAIEKFGADQIFDALREQAPEAAMAYETQLKVREAKAAVAAEEAQAKISEEQTRADLAQAKSALEALRLDQLERMTEIDE